MDLSGFTNNHERLIQKLKSWPLDDLPGQGAQSRLMPAGRGGTDPEAVRNNPEVRKAAVLALFHPVNGQSHLVFIRRKIYDGVHSGQVSFPGGKVESADRNLADTALRETDEEIGVPSSQVSIAGPLTEIYIPPSRFLVQPYIGIAESELNFRPDPREVDEIFSFPLAALMDPANIREVEVPVNQMKMRVPAYVAQNTIIWGATAMILGELTALIGRIE